MEGMDLLPIKGFVYRRKEFFASLENLTDVGVVSANPYGATSTSPKPTIKNNKNCGNSQNNSTNDKSSHSNKPQSKITTEVTSFDISCTDTSENITSRVHKSARNSSGNNFSSNSFNGNSFNGSSSSGNYFSGNSFNGSSSVASILRPKFRRANSSEKFQEKVEAYERLEMKANSETKAKAWKPLSKAEDRKEGNNSSGLSKWQSLSALDEEIRSYEKSLVKPVSSKEVETESSNTLPKKEAKKSSTSSEKSKPHWTTLFSQRLSQIRQKFEKQSKVEAPSNGVAENGGGGLQRNSGWRSSSASLSASSDVETADENPLERSYSVSEYSQSIVSMAANGAKKKSDSGMNETDRIQSARSRHNNPCTNYKDKKTFSKPHAFNLSSNQVIVNQTKPEEAKIKQIYTSLERKGASSHYQSINLTSSPSLDSYDFATRTQNDLFEKWGPFGPIEPKIVPWRAELRKTSPNVLGSKSVCDGAVTDVGGQEKDEGDSVSVKSAVTPACQPSEGFTADDKVKDRTTLKDWDPTLLLQDLYRIQLAPDEEEDFFDHITMEGYMEKLPINKKKATLLKTWKRRYFKAENGHLHYFEPPDTVRAKNEEGKDIEKPSGSIQLIGGSIETLDNRIIGIDDGRGRYLVVRAPSDGEYDKWCRSLKSQTVENIKATWVKPVVHAVPSRRRNVVVIDIGSCSVRAGILGDDPSLPSLFFPCIMATNPENGDRIFGFEALLPDTRSTHTLSYPVRPSVKVDKFAVDMAAMPDLFEKVFNELGADPATHMVMFSAPGNFSDKIKSHFMDILIHRFQVVGVNIVAQTLLSLYSYNSRSGIVVDVGERLEIVPVTDGYIVEAGVTRQPYGGHRVTEALNASFTESKYRFFTDVEFQIVRLAMENTCYVAEVYNEEVRRCQENPRTYKKNIHLDQYGLPPGTWKNVTHTQSRFSSPEGLFNTELWGMDNPQIHKLVAKAVQVCPMDMRREMWRSIFLSGGVTLLPGFSERLQLELSKLAPPSIKVQVHASPQRYHSAYIGACALANLQEFEQACIKADEWREYGPPSLRKWHMY